MADASKPDLSTGPDGSDGPVKVKTPATIRAAVALTWVVGALTSVSSVIFLVSVARDRQEYVDKVDPDALEGTGISASQVITINTVISAVTLVIAVLTIVAAFYVNRHGRRAWLALVILWVVIALTGLAGGNLLQVLIPAMVIILLFQQSAREWCGRGKVAADAPADS